MWQASCLLSPWLSCIRLLTLCLGIVAGGESRRMKFHSIKNKIFAIVLEHWSGHQKILRHPAIHLSARSLVLTWLFIYMKIPHKSENVVARKLKWMFQIAILIADLCKVLSKFFFSSKFIDLIDRISAEFKTKTWKTKYIINMQ